ncbi:hypothetical protein BDV98DRAFT_392875 [Pterulicium gracile]|uniref:ATP-dependent DNA helicase n=1 Tax=Pterulicium gracile TaxID=1884261 RepID=A0A5C3QNR4_9AGAR|nr:hypothetical protein BDV98DRAFT_392875 [Pterula gracilis]
MADEEIAITAANGVAADRLGGSTLHLFAGVDCFDLRTTNEDLLTRIASKPDVVERLSTLRVLMIDEATTLSGELLDALDYALQAIRESAEPFGGIQFLLGTSFKLHKQTLAEHNAHLRPNRGMHASARTALRSQQTSATTKNTLVFSRICDEGQRWMLRCGIPSRT